MKQVHKTIVGIGLIIAMIIPAFATAQTGTTTATSSIEALLAQIRALQAQIVALQSQQQTLVTERNAAVRDLVRTLREGLSGDDVTLLQALLASDLTIYPEGVISGYYGKLTAAAVKRFQKKHGFKQVGMVGPKTLKRLRELLSETPLEVRAVEEEDNGTTTDRVVCHKVPPGHLIAPGWLRKQNGEKPLVPECQMLPPGIAKKLGNGTTTATTTPDAVAPVISALSASGALTSALVTWTTNEPGTSKVYFGTTSPASVTSSTLSAVSGLTLTHSVSLTGLTSATTYYLVVVSADASGNSTISAQTSFTTTTAVDTTAPLISGVTTSAVASTSATVSWATNESATGNVYFGTTDPVVLASSTVVSAGASGLNQSVMLSGLTASTTYYYLVVAKDAANNAATSTQQSFSTTN